VGLLSARRTLKPTKGSKQQSATGNRKGKLMFPADEHRFAKGHLGLLLACCSLGARLLLAEGLLRLESSGLRAEGE